VEERSPALDAAIRRIDAFTAATGKLVSLLLLFLVAAVCYECIARYLFNAPTHWVLETSVMANGSAFMLGCGYALLKGAHVRTDIFWERYSERWQGAIDLAAYLLLFFPTMVVLMWISIDDAWYSFQIRETSVLTPLGAKMWPFRAAVPLAALLLIVQGVSEALKSWCALRTGRTYERRARGEL
jgi:TRAP-type mannitol/chloroaromatic compound transport system permease small subunit